ncbi:MAG: IS1182 family transposase [Ignavibacteria bacterium]
MRYIEGINRDQIILFPETVDEYVSEDNMIRFLDAYVSSLNMVELGFTYSEPKETGRKAYDPSDMLKLYIYGYMKKIRSSRLLESETQRNVELMWLMKKLQPDFKTIADFRKDNIESIKKVCREFTIFCRKLNLYAGELVSIDGSKFKAVNNKEKCYTRNYIKSELKEIDENINKYIKEIEKIDTQENKFSKLDPEELKQIIENLGKERQEIEEMLKEIENGNVEQVSKTDKDSRMMKTSGSGYQVSYNAQISVDTKHHMIVASEVTNQQNDLNCLSQIAEDSKQILELERLKVVCDTGYYSEKEINKCDNNNIECYVAVPKKFSNESEGKYGLHMFRYDETTDTYICPQSKEMTYRFTYSKGNRTLRRYESSQCSSCQQKKNCTDSKGNRYVNRSELEGIMEKVKSRMLENRDILKTRSKTVEHVFGTLKQWMGYGGSFLLKGIDKVNGEFSLLVMTYNLKRAIKIVGVHNLIKSLAT